jgi:hypothetical protein
MQERNILQRPMVWTLAAVALAFLIAQLALDHYLTRQGESDLYRAASGQSRIGFEFAHRRDLISAAIEGADSLRVANGVTSADLPGGNANVRLNLRGLKLDAHQFRHLDARIQVSAASELYLIFDEPGQLRQLTSKLELNAGWNEIKLALSAVQFTPKAGGSAQRWGGDSGFVGEFRLYFIGPPGLKIGLDRLHFLDSEQHTGRSAVHWLDAAQAQAHLAQGWSRPEAGAPRLGVLLPTLTARPEFSLDLRDRVRRVDAEALFWPAWRGPPDPAQTKASAAAGWAPGWPLIVLYGVLAAGLRWRSNSGTKLLIISELLLGYGPILALTLGLGLDEEIGSQNATWLALALGFQLSGWRSPGSHWLGGRQAWTAMLKMLAIGGSALLLAAAASDYWQLPGAQRVAGYLPFVLLQQAMLLGFVLPRVAALAPGRALPISAGLFALAHAPNFALMLLSLLAAGWWISQFQRHRSWLPIIVSHYLLGLLAITCLPPHWLYSAEVGLRYFQVQ